MKRLKSEAIKFDVFIIAFSVIFFFVIGIASGAVLDKRLNENVSRRAVSELSTTAKEQAQLVEREIERQFIPLNFLAAYLSGGNAFTDKETRNMIDTLVETNTWCTVGYADLEGNTISYEGENLGNISQRAYFKEIADGSETQKVEYPHEIQVGFFEEAFTPSCEGWKEYTRLDRRARHLIRKLRRVFGLKDSSRTLWEEYKAFKHEKAVLYFENAQLRKSQGFQSKSLAFLFPVSTFAATYRGLLCRFAPPAVK